MFCHVHTQICSTALRSLSLPDNSLLSSQFAESLITYSYDLLSPFVILYS